MRRITEAGLEAIGVEPASGADQGEGAAKADPVAATIPAAQAEAPQRAHSGPYGLECQRRRKNQPRGGAIVYHLGDREVAPEWGARALARALPK